MTVLYVFLIILMVALMFLLPPAMQFKTGINPEYFPKIKVNTFAFMFRGIGMKGGKYYSVKDYGVIAPMYALHLLGYSLALLSLIISPVIIFVAELEVWQTDLILLYMLLIEAVICVATDVTCCIISKRKDGKNKAETQTNGN